MMTWWKKTNFWATLTTLLVALPLLSGCVADEEPAGDTDDYGIDGELAPDGPVGKADSRGIAGPAVATNTSATQVWTARNKWEDTDAAAGIAWEANSGLNWDQKYALWIQAMPRIDGNDTYYETFEMTTPWGKKVPAPKLECAEMAIFFRIAFASWYALPFYMTAVDSSGTRVYFGHFGARTKTSRYKNTPKFAQYYKDYSNMTVEQIASEGWPQDQKLRAKGLYGGGDDMPFIAEGAKAGTYFDEVFLNKRTGHFMNLTLAYFGSMHLASSRNTYNLKPESVQAGDVLVERWQRRGIGHTLVVKSVKPVEGGLLEANLASGSMPRRQPKWEDAVASKQSFTDARTGGLGESWGDNPEPYSHLGGGLKRFRVTKNINGKWTNTWMKGDEASWINDTDYAAIEARPETFDRILGQVSPEKMQEALVLLIEDARNHLRQYPASCSARIKREHAFKALYELNAEEFGLDNDATDAQYRTLEDYVFAELVYEESKTCCWNSSNAAMYQIALEYNQELVAGNSCAEPVVFMNDGGYNVFKQYAEQTGRGHLWNDWSEDETCSQRDVTSDTVRDSEIIPWCARPEGGEPPPPTGCTDDAFEDNDTAASSSPVSSGTHSGLMICSGDDDFYTIDAVDGTVIRIDFNHSEGDLDLDIVRNGESIASSATIGDYEVATVAGAGTVTVRVYGYQGAGAGYQLSVQ